MLRFVILGLVVLWIVATIGRFARRLGRGPRVAVRGAGPAPEAEPGDDRLIGVLRVALGALFVIVFFVALSALTDLPELLVVLVSAPVAGLLSALITERFVSEDDA